jgi:histidine triad (HIT) family protein
MGRNPDCVFCKIVSGEIPSETIFDTEEALAFLDVGPLAEGHLLLIPKDHYETLDKMPAELVARVCSHLPKLGNALRRVTEVGAYNVLQNNGRTAGQAVGHVHFHLIPRVEGDGLGYRWHPKAYAEGRAGELGGRLRSAIEGAR